MNPLKRFSSLLLLGLTLALAAGCQSDSPTEPSGDRPATPKPPDPVVSYVVSVTASPAELTAGSATPSTITVEVRRTDNGQPAPELTPVTLTTTLGEFGSAGSGQTSVSLQLVNGRAQAFLFPGGNLGVATVRAQVNGAAGAANVAIGQQATFFVSSVQPSVGNPNGGEEVSIHGGGFDSPVRVTFNGTAAQVLSVTSTRIRVRTPSAVAAGVDVGVGESVPITVGVTINYNETGQAQDSLPNGFIYALGGISQPQIVSVTPSSGSNDGGTRVQILGDGFEAPVQVFFGQGTSGTSFNGVEGTVESVTRTRIIAVTPAARGFGQNNLNQQVDILVKNLNSGFAGVGPGLYKYGSQVLITSMGPGSGPYTGGTPVILYGQGFDEPVAVTLGGIGQTVLSVTGTEIVFRTAGVTLSTCPSSGVFSVTGVSVTNIETGDSATANNLGFNYIVPRPLITGITPNLGTVGSTATISGEGFATNVQVLFGDANNGSSAQIGAHSPASIAVTIPTPPPGFNFNTVPCDGPDPDTVANGTRATDTPISVTVRNLDATGCVVTLSNAFTLRPTGEQAQCTGDTPTTLPECSDGIDNEAVPDGLIDFPADPQCTNASDTSETV